MLPAVTAACQHPDDEATNLNDTRYQSELTHNSTDDIQTQERYTDTLEGHMTILFAKKR